MIGISLKIGLRADCRIDPKKKYKKTRWIVGANVDNAA
jgi:hypothetical protein